MKRRSFLKRVGAFVGICYVNPTALIPESKVEPFIMKMDYESVDYALNHEWSKEFIIPAMRKLADDIDEYILTKIMEGEEWI